MKIENGAFVALTYELTVDGQIVDKATADKPLEFIYGAGLLLPAFEKQIEGLQAGDSFSFKLEAPEAYGEKIQEAVIELPKSSFMMDGQINNDMLTVGNHIPMMDNQGNQMVGVVKDVKDETVLMDFNHPMAGKELNFTGKIEEVREATDADKAKFMQMGGGCSCGCDDASCEGGSCGSHAEESACGCGCGH